MNGVQHTTLVVVDTDCTGSCKSNDHMTTTAPGRLGIAVQLTRKTSSEYCFSIPTMDLSRFSGIK